MKNEIIFKTILLKLPALFSTFVLLIACNNKELPDLKGRYQGTLKSPNETTQLVAQIPDFISTSDSKVLSFKIFQTLGTAKGNEYRMIVINEKTLQLNAPFLSSSGVLLTRKGNCATSKDILFCWSKGKIDLKVNFQESIELHLVRDNKLPPLHDPNIQRQTYSLDELVGRSKFLNYTVSQEAERVLQAKQNIGVARGNLLPKLHIRAVIGIFTGDYLSIIGSALPFIFPSNWYRWEQSKAIFEAQKKSFASLRGNEINFIEGLFYLILRDQTVLSELKKHITWMNEIKEGLIKEELIGTIPIGTADYFSTNITLLEKDQAELEKLIQNQYGELAQAVALPPLNGILELAPIKLPSLDGISSIQGADFFKNAQNKAFEIKTLKALYKAAQNIDGEIAFGFLDPEGNSGLGFGTASSFRVSKSRQNEIQKKIDEVSSLLELRSSQVATEYNLELQNYAIAEKGLAAIERRITWLINRHLNGSGEEDETEFVDQLVELQFKRMGFIADKASSIYAWLMAKARLDRLLLKGFYSSLEEGLPQN